jgi:hypothetical protein
LYTSAPSAAFLTAPAAPYVPFAALFVASAVLSAAFSVLSAASSVLSAAFSALYAAFSVLSAAFSFLSAAFSILSAAFSVLCYANPLSGQFSSHHCVTIAPIYALYSTLLPCRHFAPQSFLAADHIQQARLVGFS